MANMEVADTNLPDSTWNSAEMAATTPAEAVQGAALTHQQRTDSSLSSSGLSKNQRKRMLKAERFAQMRPLRKIQAKEKRKAKKLKKKTERPLDDVEPDARRQVPFRASVVIDCGFDALMTEKEIISMTAQLSQLYSRNRKAERPFSRVVISGQGDAAAHSYAASTHCSDEELGPVLATPELPKSTPLLSDRIGRRMEEQMQGNWNRWSRFLLRSHGGLEGLCEDVAVNVQDENHHEDKSKDSIEILPALCSKSSMVYLTADTDDVLETIDEGKTYIIGGIVDRNRYKGLCANKARALGVPMARLPIPPHFLKSSNVLTINSVFEIILTYNATRDWTAALERCLPKRKRAEGDQGTSSAVIGDAAQDCNGHQSVSDDDLDRRVDQDDEEDDDEIYNSSAPHR